MGKIKTYPPVNPVRNFFLPFKKRGISNGVKLISGFIFKEDVIYAKTRIIFKRYFGKIDFESDSLPFTHTDYYKEEFGTNLKRRFISLEKLINPYDLYKIKIFTNKIEGRLSTANRRLINIDPGYLDLSKLVLASTKNYYHRIYLNKGIFAEVTLFFQDKTFKELAWTYPDYQSSEYSNIFKQIREIYVRQIKGL